MKNKEVCGTCKHNKYDCVSDFYCGNEESDYHGIQTAYDDTCECWEEKEDV